MKIHLTKNEYRLLIELLTMCEWVMHAHEVDSNEKCKDHDSLIQKMMSYYMDFKCEDLIEYDKVGNKYYQTIIEDPDSPINDLIKEYETEVFWEELSHRLARRDTVEKLGRKKMSEMKTIERMEAISEETVKYYKEFEKNGLDNLIIKNK